MRTFSSYFASIYIYCLWLVLTHAAATAFHTNARTRAVLPRLCLLPPCSGDAEDSIQARSMSGSACACRACAVGRPDSATATTPPVTYLPTPSLLLHPPTMLPLFLPAFPPPNLLYFLPSIPAASSFSWIRSFCTFLFLVFSCDSLPSPCLCGCLFISVCQPVFSWFLLLASVCHYLCLSSGWFGTLNLPAFTRALLARWQHAAAARLPRTSCCLHIPFSAFLCLTTLPLYPAEQRRPQALAYGSTITRDARGSLATTIATSRASTPVPS